MKKIYTALFLFCFIATSATAQFTKGQKVIGGNVGFSINKYENPNANYITTKISSISVSPAFGWFSKPNVLCGIGLSYGYNYQKIENPSFSSVQKVYRHFAGINVFSQRFFPLSQNLFFTIQSSAAADYRFGEEKNKINGNDSKVKISGYDAAISLAPGLSYRLTQRLLFDAYLSNLINVSYFHEKSKYDYPAPNGSTQAVQSSFSLSSSLSNTNLRNVGLGFRWLLKK